ncbi:MAG: PilW family protein [Methylovulum sp.]|nr:PilW family protein [Methylovulum sp.]
MKHQQHGFTLVELLITMVLSSLLIASVSQIFLQSRKSFAKQQSLSAVVEDGRYAVEMMAQEFRRAGFLANPRRTDAGFAKANIFAANPNNPAGSGINFLSQEYIRGSFSAAGIDSPNDINHVVFRYQLDPGGSCSDPVYIVKAECLEVGNTWTPSGTDMDSGNSPCSAQVSDENGVTPGSAYIKTISFFVNDTGNGPTLSCQAESQLKNNGTVIDNNGNNSMPLVSNVEALYVLYGVDTDGNNSANRYVNASDVKIYVRPTDGVTIDEWTHVVSVRLYLVLMSNEKNVATGSTSTYTIDGTTYNVLNPSDNRLYRVFTTTVAFRN